MQDRLSALCHSPDESQDQAVSADSSRPATTPSFAGTGSATDASEAADTHRRFEDDFHPIVSTGSGPGNGGEGMPRSDDIQGRDRDARGSSVPFAGALGGGAAAAAVAGFGVHELGPRKAKDTSDPSNMNSDTFASRGSGSVGGLEASRAPLSNGQLAFLGSISFFYS